MVFVVFAPASVCFHEITRGLRAGRGAERSSTPVVVPLRGIESRFPWKPRAARRNRPRFHEKPANWRRGSPSGPRLSTLTFRALRDEFAGIPQETCLRARTEDGAISISCRALGKSAHGVRTAAEQPKAAARAASVEDGTSGAVDQSRAAGAGIAGLDAARWRDLGAGCWAPPQWNSAGSSPIGPAHCAGACRRCSRSVASSPEAAA